MADTTKTCPFCKEEIHTDAIKCKHCQSMLTEPPPVSDSAPPIDATVPLEDRTLPLSDFKNLLGGRYELLGVLGKGGMGVVHKAHDKQLEIDVAIKLLPDFLARDKRGVEILKTEARAAIKLSHPNIIRLFNFEDRPDGKFLLMEFIDGKTLDEIMDESPNKRIPEKDLVRYAIEACRGLGYAHSQGVIHRDIKPSNMMVDSKGQVKITDFGIARVVKESQTRQTGVATSGTLLYMSPEQIRGKRCDARSDIYSMGIALYEMLTGNVPFLSGDITHQHLSEKPATMDGVSKELNAIVLKCLEKEPEKRFQSTGELMRALQTGRPDVAPDAEIRPTSSARKRSVYPVVAGLLVILAVGLLFYFVYKKPASHTTDSSISGGVAIEGLEGDTSFEIRDGKGEESADMPGQEQSDIEKIGEGKRSAEESRDRALEARAATWFPEVWQSAEEKFKKARQLERAGDAAGAKEIYREVAVDYRSVMAAAQEIEAEKESSEEVKKMMTQARAEAEEVDAMTHAPDPWQEGESQKKQADEFSQSWEYASAEESYRRAAQAYAQAGEQARLKQGELSTEKDDEGRRRADEARTQAERAKNKADAERAAQYAADSYGRAERKFAEAETNYRKKDYARAAGLYQEAVELFRTCEQEAGKRDSLPSGLVRKDGKIICSKDGEEMLPVPAGDFVMGSPPGEGGSDERPLHRVYLDAFYMDKYEVTVGQYMKFVYETGHRGPPAWLSKYSPGVNNPVVGVSWDDAAAYAKWAGKRLPTEAEWEKAARGADGRKYPWGIGEPGSGGYKANYNPGQYGQDGHEFTSPVGSFQNGKSPFGVHDLAGNVAEWCLDWYGASYYKEGSIKNPKGPSTGAERVVRGGSWRGFAGLLRASSRGFFRPQETQIDVGFRCVKD